jgi:hypothetical protein
VRRQITFGIGSYYFGSDEGDELKGLVGQVRRNTSFGRVKREMELGTASIPLPF